MSRDLTDIHNVVLVGCGSMGGRYLDYIISRNINCVVVDPRAKELSARYKGHESIILWVENLEQIPNNFQNRSTLGIVSNWGPDHFETISHLISKKLLKFIVEKPIVSRLIDLIKLERIVSKMKLSIVVNQGWESSNYSEKLLDIFYSLNLGELKMIVVHGGARCISTAGSHYIHMAQKLFNLNPVLISATLNSGNINPRHVDLNFLQGVLTIEFSNQKYLSINFSNESAVEGSVNLYWRESVATIVENNITIQRLSQNRDYAKVITRYSTPEIEIYNSHIVDDPLNSNGSIKKLFDEFSKSEAIMLKNFDLHLNSNRLLLMGLVSNDLKKALTPTSSIRKKYSHKEYRIS